jgi:hypothetical protein
MRNTRGFPILSEALSNGFFFFSLPPTGAVATSFFVALAMSFCRRAAPEIIQSIRFR